MEDNVPEIRLKGFTGDWIQRKLGDVTTKIGSGKTPQGGSAVYLQQGIPLLRSQNITNDAIDLSDVVYISDEIDRDMANSRVQENDVLLNITGASIGRSAVYRHIGIANVNQHVCIIRPTQDVNAEYLQLNLASFNGQQQIDYNQAGGGREGLNFQQIAKIAFYFPTIEEQTAIGEFFRALDENTTLHKQKLDGLRKLKKGYLQQMFPQTGETVPRVRLQGFTEPWEQRKLGEHAAFITKGTTPIDKSGNGEINFVKVENIVDGEIKSTSKISTEEHNGYLKRSRLEEGDILFSIAGTLGRTAVVDKLILPANTNQALAIIRDYDFDTNFLITSFSTHAVSEFIKKNPTIGAQPNLSLEQIKDLIIYAPSREEQIFIGNFFHNLNSQITAQSQKVEQLKQLKTAYLQKMFV